MDKNQIAGLVLMLALLTVYFQFFAPDPPVTPESTENIQDSTATTNQEVDQTTDQVAAVTEIPDSVKSAQAYTKYGAFALLTEGESERDIKIDNDVIDVTFSSKGGKVKSVVLKDYLSYDNQPLLLLDEISNNFEIALRHGGKKISLNDLNFSTVTTNRTVSEGDSLKIIFTATLSPSQSIQQIYTLSSNSYEIGYQIKANGLSDLIDKQNLELNWQDNLRRLEKDLPQARNRTSLVYSQSKEVDDLTSRSSGLEEETLNGPIDWVSFSQKFFTAGVISNSSFKQGYVSMQGDEEDTVTVRTMTANLLIPVNDVLGTGYGMKFYYGPNNYKILKNVTAGFDANVDLGWSVLKVINKFLIINIFQWLEQYLSSYGLIIFIMVILIKLLLSPLTYKSHMSMAKMRVLKPDLDELKEKIGDDAQKMQVEQMALYKKAGINPLSGCIPMVLQMPVLFAMFYFFPNSIELRQEGFLWAHDLSTYDSVFSWTANIPLVSQFYGNHVSLFTLLMTASTILYTWSNSRVSSVTGPMKTMQYIMPIMFLFFLNNYSSGLTFYYFVSNIVSFGQIALFRKFVDEDKIRAILEENKKKNANKKKSKFASRLEDAMKASEEARRQKAKNK